MIHYTTYRINNELNPRFSFISFNIDSLSLLKSVFTNLFSIETLQIQFYNLLGSKDNPTTNQSQNEHGGEGKDAFFVQFGDNFITSFDVVLFPRNFKIPI